MDIMRMPVRHSSSMTWILPTIINRPMRVFERVALTRTDSPRRNFAPGLAILDNHFTVGPAILWSPFLIVAHGTVMLARLTGSKVPANGFSGPYRYALALGTGFYGFLALLLSFRLASKYVGNVVFCGNHCYLVGQFIYPFTCTSIRPGHTPTRRLSLLFFFGIGMPHERREQ